MPVMQFGIILANGQLTEEQFSANEDQPKGTETTIHFLTFDLRSHFLLHTPCCLIAQNENFHSRQADDIKTPPPNIQ